MLFFLLACTHDISSVTEILDAAAPMAWAGTLAWASHSGEESPCVLEETLGVLQLDPGCPQALSGAVSKDVVVTVAGVEDDALVFGVVFGELESGQLPRLQEAGSATVLQTDEGLAVAWIDEDLSVSTEAAEISQGTWTVLIDVAGTPGDPSDDTLNIQGTRQWVAATTGGDSVAVQTVLALVRTDPSCRRNPISGGAVIEAASASSQPEAGAGVDMGTVAFVDSCDGNALFTGAGSSGFAAGAPVNVERAPE